jgi:hypothetical protein
MSLKLSKNALPWLVLAVLLPLLALSLTAVPVGAGCPCGEDNPPAPAGIYVIVDVSPSGGGDVEIKGELPHNYPVVRTLDASQPVSLEALPADGYYFVGWSGEISGNENPIEVKLTTDNAEITAHFFPEEIVSEDNRLQIVFPVGTVAQDREGKLLMSLEVAINEAPPPPEAGIVGLPYELGPHGATFNQPITINFSYDPEEIPPRVAEADLVMGYYDEDSGQWLFLPSVADMASHTVTTLVDHLSTFAVIAPIPPPLPAAFTTSALTVHPLETDIGEAVIISVLVTNTGEVEGSYNVALALNGTVEESRVVTLAGGSQQVVFSTSGGEAGDYSVEVNGLEGSFTVREAPILPIVLPSVVIWAILGLALAALVAAGVIYPIVRMGRTSYY